MTLFINMKKKQTYEIIVTNFKQHLENARTTEITQCNNLTKRTGIRKIQKTGN